MQNQPFSDETAIVRIAVLGYSGSDADRIFTVVTSYRDWAIAYCNSNAADSSSDADKRTISDFCDQHGRISMFQTFESPIEEIMEIIGLTGKVQPWETSEATRISEQFSCEDVNDTEWSSFRPIA